MKKIIFSILILLATITYSQEGIEDGTESEKRRIDNHLAVQLEIQGSAFMSLDDNFISQAYSQDIGFIINLRFGVKEFFGIGLNFNRYEFSIDDSRFLGSSFPSSRFYSNTIFGYYQHPLFKNLTGEIKLGLFNGNILNRSVVNSFFSTDKLRLNLSGLMTGINMVYYIGSQKHVGISLGADLYFSLSDKIQTAPSEQNFINRNTFTTINLGIVFGN